MAIARALAFSNRLCLPRVPIANKTTHIVVATDDQLAEGYEDVEAMVRGGGWEARTLGTHPALAVFLRK